MSLQLDPPIEKKVRDLRKSYDSVVWLILGTTVLPIIWPIMIALAPLHALKRRSILSDEDVSRWFKENQGIDLKALSKEQTLEGSLARIQTGAILPWLPVIIPAIALLVVFIGVQFL
jgi:hypothetical protein